MTDTVAADLLVRAVEDDFAAAWWLIGEASGAEMHAEGGLRWFSSGTDERLLNPVLATRLDAASADDAIDGLLDDLGRRGAPFVWWLHPSATPVDLGGRLAARGLQPGGVWPGLALRAEALVEPPPVPGLAIRRVTSDAELDVYFEVFGPILSPSPTFTSVFRAISRRIGYAERTPEAHFVGWLDGQAVATVSLLTAGGAAGIYNVTTVERARGRGIGAAMTAAAVRLGRDRGLAVATLQASELGRPVYERLAFRFVCDLVPYRYPEERT